MLDSIPHTRDPGTAGRRGHVCQRCGYGITLARPILPSCPMCRARAWAPEPAERSRPSAETA